MEFWIAGILFTFGITTKQTKTVEKERLFNFLHIPLWPLILGMWIAEYLKAKKEK